MISSLIIWKVKNRITLNQYLQGYCYSTDCCLTNYCRSLTENSYMSWNILHILISNQNIDIYVGCLFGESVNIISISLDKYIVIKWFCAREFWFMGQSAHISFNESNRNAKLLHNEFNLPPSISYGVRLIQGLYSLSGKTSYRKISWSLEAARFGFKLLQWLWNLAGTSAALLPKCLSNFRAIRPLQHPISRLRDFTLFGGKTSYRLVNRGPAGLVLRKLIDWCW